MDNLDRDRQKVLHSIFTQNVPTRSSIAKSVGLSLIKISSILSVLEKNGSIIKKGKTTTKSGRPSFIYSLTSDFGYSVGVSLAPGSFRIVIVNSAKELLYDKVFKLKIPNHPDKQIEAILESITEKLKSSINDQLGNKQPLAIGFALPGMVDVERGVWLRGLQLSGISNVPVKDVFTDRFKLPVFVDDISRSITYREMYVGSGIDISDFILLYVGIGLGAGVVIDGKVFHGFHGLGGEIGHIQHINNKYRCSCGSIGCLETVVSEPGILHVFRERLHEGVVSYLQKYTYGSVEALTLDNILTAAENNDHLAVTALREIGEFLGDTCAILIKLFDPEKIIVSGYGARFKNYFREPVNRVITQRVLPEMLKNFKLNFSDYEHNQEAIGAAFFALKNILDTKVKSNMIF